MNKEFWEYNEKGTVCTENDANDYFYEWVSLSAPNMSLEGLFQEFLGAGVFDVPVRIKARKGAIFIVSAGDKDDTENPIE